MNAVITDPPYGMGKADWDLPFLVVRTHAEEVDGEELRFALVAMRPDDEDAGGALFGELASLDDNTTPAP